MNMLYALTILGYKNCVHCRELDFYFQIIFILIEMKIAVEGCAHGELDRIYDAIEHLQKKENVKVDLLICCGDFQSTRNLDDLQCMAVPRKYQSMCSFYK